jgi:hypothetical protein
MIPYKKILLVLFLMFLQFNLNFISMFVPQGFFFYCHIILMGLNLLVVALLTLPHKVFSPTLFCLFWFLTVAKQILPKGTMPDVFMIIFWGAMMIAIPIEVGIFRYKLAKLAEAEASSERQ